MKISYSVKNVGQSPAIDVIPSFAVSALDTDALPSSLSPKCTVPDKDHPTKQDRPVFYLMPGDKTANRQAEVYVSPELEGSKKTDNVWLQVCISYRDEFWEYYLTKLTYISSYDPSSQYVTVPGTEFRYRPITGWSLYKGEVQ